MRLNSMICFILALGLLQVSCNSRESTDHIKSPYPEGHFTQQIEQLRSADVTNDVDAAIRKQDFRFLVCIDFGGTVPGVPAWTEELYKKYGTRVIDGTGDMIMNEEQRQFKDMAASYAAAYNKLLWAKIKE